MSALFTTSIIPGRGRNRVAPEIELPDIPTGFPCHTSWDRTMGGAA